MTSPLSALIDRLAQATGPAENLAERDRPCTCHPDDNPPVPCPKRYAYSECIAWARAKALERVADAARAHINTGMDWMELYNAVADLDASLRAIDSGRTE